MGLNELAQEIRNTAVAHGFNVDGERNFGETIALCHSELSEAMEEWRKNRDYSYYYYRESDGKPEGIAFEMADTIIRILEFFASANLDPERFVKEKMSFNNSRPYMHNKLS